MNLFLDILRYNNYEPIKIKEYKKNNLEIKQIYPEKFALYVDDVQWMTYDFYTHEQVFEVFSHYYLAKGHCICTGLGFGARESWLLNNKRVNKITVIEKSKDIIEYHKENNPDLMSRIEVINSDCLQYFGECDTLLLDHYENESSDEILKNAKIVSDNIKCDNMFIWPLEKILISTKNNYPNLSFLDIYNQIKKEYSLNKLPILDEETINKFIQAVRVVELL
jgi:hypothetical protein